MNSTMIHVAAELVVVTSLALWQNNRLNKVLEKCNVLEEKVKMLENLVLTQQKMLEYHQGIVNRVLPNPTSPRSPPRSPPRKPVTPPKKHKKSPKKMHEEIHQAMNEPHHSPVKVAAPPPPVEITDDALDEILKNENLIDLKNSEKMK